MSKHTDVERADANESMSWPPLAEMVEDFAFLDDWEDRYMHVIDLGKSLKPITDAERVPANKVEGCASQVWLVSERVPSPASSEPGGSDAGGPGAGSDVLRFRGDSDAHIVRGLIAVVIAALSGRKAEDILATDMEAVMAELGLGEHLSSQRANGLRAMVARIRAEAGES